MTPPPPHSQGSAVSLLREWSSLDSKTVLERLGSDPGGLSEEEALSRLKQDGPNMLEFTRRKGPLVRILLLLKNPLNILLLTLATLSFFMGSHESALIISFMVILSVSLSFIQEDRSSRAVEELRHMVRTTATVRRKRPAPEPRGSEPSSQWMPDTQEIPLSQLVRGDVIHLSAGDMIPADLRLLSAKDLFIDQSPLTGEAMPVEKFAHAADREEPDPFLLPNICFMGTTVLSGTATGVLLLTGLRASFGKVAHAVARERAPTSFDLGVDRFAWLMIRFILVMAPLVFLINGLTKEDWISALLFATAVAVGLTPEMLPMIVTVNLAKGALAMSRKKVIVKRLNAIQNIGAMDVLCTDKTGTLTQNRVILVKHVDLSGAENEEVLELAYLNSFYQSGLKNLLDMAVLEFKEIHDRLIPVMGYRKVDEIPFDFLRRRMSVIVEKERTHLLITKGAIEEVFSVCEWGKSGNDLFRLDPGHLEQFRALGQSLNEDGFRVISIAYKEMDCSRETYAVPDESELTLIGFIAFLDPPKETAMNAIEKLEEHGVKVKILTGDNEVVTLKVCREVNLSVKKIVLGTELDRLSDEELGGVAENTQVFARVSPDQKSRIIEMLRKKGHVVGYLGDGINDSPALRSADVGISVDTGVDIAKESADIVLLEKSLLILDEGASEGRKVFGNIVKYIRMGASSNFGNMFSVLGASAWLPFLPMLPIQVLTNNLLYDFSQTSIPTDTVDPEYLLKPRKWEIGNIARFMLLIGPISSLFDYATYFIMYDLFQANTPGKSALFQTGWFVESLLSQTLIIHVIRTNRIPFVKSRASLPLTLTTLSICTLGIMIPYSPIGPSLGFVHLPPLYWPILATMILSYMALTYLLKKWYQRKFGLD